MKTKNLMVGAASICIATLLSPANAALILAVDFNNINGSNPVTGTEDGFQAFDIAQVTSSKSKDFTSSVGTLTVAIPLTTSTSRDRGAITETAPFTYSDLLRDGAAQIAITSQTNVSFTISGLAASTSYTIQLWSLNKGNDVGVTFTWFDRSNAVGTAGEVLLGSIANNASPAPTTNDDFSITATATTNAAGELIFRQDTGGNTTGFLNGFMLSTLAVPEPSTAALAMLGSLALLRRRRA